MGFSYKEFRKLSFKKPIVYLVSSYNNKHLKIGTANHPISRLSQIQTCQPGPITIVSFIESDNYALIEKKLHKEFSDYNVHGEWFTNEIIIVERFFELGGKYSLQNIGMLL